MNCFHTPSSELPPLAPPENDKTALIMDTLERVQLDPESVLLVGSAALTLYGAQLDISSAPFTDYSRRPSDLDFLATPCYMEEVYRDGEYNGLSVARKVVSRTSTTVIRIGARDSDTLDTLQLPIDLLSTYIERGASGRHSKEAFNARQKKRFVRIGRPIDGTPIHVLRSKHLQRELKRRSTSEKALSDLRALNRALK